MLSALKGKTILLEGLAELSILLLFMPPTSGHSSGEICNVRLGRPSVTLCDV